MQKGMSVAMWIWIIGGVLIAGLLFVMVVNNMGFFTSQKSREAMLDQFRLNIVNKADLICASSIGSVNPSSVELKNVQAIYAAEKPRNVDPKAPLYITQKNYSIGKYLCMSFDNEGCKEMTCEINMTYIGTPLKTSDMYKIGISDGSFEFDLSIQKNEHSKVLISATHRP